MRILNHVLLKLSIYVNNIRYFYTFVCIWWFRYQKLIGQYTVTDYLNLFPNLRIHSWTWYSVIEGMTVLS